MIRISIILSMTYFVVVVYTMQQLSLTIQILFNEMDERKARCREFASLLMIVITLICLIGSQLSPVGGMRFRVALLISCLISIVPYSYMTIKLVKSLNKFTDRTLDKEAFDNEIKSIKV